MSCNTELKRHNNSALHPKILESQEIYIIFEDCRKSIKWKEIKKEIMSVEDSFLFSYKTEIFDKQQIKEEVKELNESLEYV